MIAEAMQKVGNEGVITVEEAKTAETELEVVEGMQFDRGYLSPYFVTNPDKMIAELDDPYILLHEKKLSNLQAMLPVLEAVVQSSRPLLIIAEDVRRRSAGHPGGQQAAWRPQGRCRQGSGLRRPPQGHAGRHRHPDRRPGDLRRPRHQAGKRHPGHAGPCQARLHHKENTTIVDGAGKKKTSKPACSQIRKQIEDTTSDYDREKLQERLAKLAGGVAVIRVGGATEIEVKEKQGPRRRRPERDPRCG
jgi:chaperonin GroEL